MRIVLIGDVFPPVRSSGALQLGELSQEFARQGHQVTVITPRSDQDKPCQVELWNGVQILRLKGPQTRDLGYVHRTIGEFLIPFAMVRGLRAGGIDIGGWEGVVWYSPTIFLGPIVKRLKRASDCKGYLIVRDIFPEWAVDMGLMGRGLPYWFFKFIERSQYAVANVIGVQTPASISYFDAWASRKGRRVEVLYNWLVPGEDLGCSISVATTRLAGRKIFVYAGNMGVAQGMDIMLDLAAALRAHNDIGFLFVGRGSVSACLREDAVTRGLDNVAFFDEIDPSEIPGLFAQCQVGLVSLDPRHRTHNIPGKFLSYMQYGLPVLANINSGNDLEKLIVAERVGRVSTEASVKLLPSLALSLIDEIAQDAKFKFRCKDLAAKMFCAETAVKQIVQALNEK